MRSDSQVKLSLTEQRMIRNSRALYWCSRRHCADGGGQAGQRGEDLHQGLVQTRTVTWTTCFLQCRFEAFTGPDGHFLCVSNTLFKTCLSFVSDNQMPGAADGDGRTRLS